MVTPHYLENYSHNRFHGIMARQSLLRLINQFTNDTAVRHFAARTKKDTPIMLTA